MAGELVGRLAKRGRFLTAESFFEPGPRVVVDRDSRANVGDIVLVRSRGHGRGHAKIVRRLGRPDNAGDVLEALMLHRGLRRRFDRSVDLEAQRARDEHARADHDGRSDLRQLPTFTIDPVTAKDFDDAISAQHRDDGTIRVWVHIADVSAFVRPGGAVDREAARRSTSVYVPGRVEPMLPEALSSDACSLRPHADRLAVTVRMDVDAEGVVRRVTFVRSLVRSDERLDYPRVDRIFAGREGAAEPWATPLEAAREAARALAHRRARGSALEIENPEPEFAFDRKGHVVAMAPSLQTESHRLIEHLMIAANEQVAKHLAARRIPTLYRVHEPPEPDAARRLVAQLASLGVDTPRAGDHLSADAAAELIAQCSRAVDEHVRRRDGRGRIGLTFLVLRALKQAHYAPRNLGHAGLGLEYYCHFTSPIRRYPDLVCHRALLSSVGAGEEAPDRGRLDELGTWTSARERDAMTIERDADRVARCFLLERELFAAGVDTTFEGEVTGVIGAGAFVRFGEGHEGLLPVRRLTGDWWELNEEGTILHGTRSGAVLRLGDPVAVRVERIEAPRGRVDLAPADAVPV
jgi:ribonuclease R